MTPQEIGEAAVALKQGTLAQYRKGDEIAILASALCKCLADLPTADERLSAVLLVLAAFSTIGIYMTPRPPVIHNGPALELNTRSKKPGGALKAPSCEFGPICA